MPQTVRIVITDGPAANPSSPHTNPGDTVIFDANPPSLQFSVDFKGSDPFGKKHFDNNNNRGTVQHNKKDTHKYDLTVNGQTLDPVIIVDGN